MKAVLIQLKVKDTEPLNWSKALASYLKKSYGSAQWSQFYDAKKTKELDQLRINANSDLAAEALLEQNLMYYAYLEQMYLRLGNQSNQLDLSFTWYDAEYGSDTLHKYKQHTLVFEKSSILYNIGVILTHIASDKLRLDYKESLPYLSKAVSCFNYMSETFLNSPSIDLRVETTKFLASLLHAEAQELFLLKLINGPDTVKRASLISKLAFSCCKLYEECREFYSGSDGEFASSVPYGQSKWKSIVFSKYYLYEAIAAYNYGISLEQIGKVGHAVAFLKLASTSIAEALQNNSHSKEIIAAESIGRMIDEKLKSVSKDNDYIYHEHIPSDVTLEVIKPMHAIKLTPFDAIIDEYLESVSESCNEIFKGIVPLDVYEKESIYSEEKSQLLRKELDAVETADWELESFVEFMNLPKLLQDLETRFTGLSTVSEDPQIAIMREHLKAWSETVTKSPFSNIEKLTSDIFEKRKSIMSLLNTVPTPNKEDIVKIKTSLIQASQSDENLFSLVKPYVSEIKLLNNFSLLWNNFNSFNTSQDQSNLLDIDDRKNEEILSKLKSVKEQYENLKILRDERTITARDLKEKMNEDDITKILILNRQKSDTRTKAIFQEELEKFKPLSTRIEATIFKQANVINDIKIALDTIFKLMGTEGKTAEDKENDEKRKELYNRLQHAITSFTVFSNDFPKGLAFYDMLLQMTKDLVSASANSPQSSSNTAYGLDDIPPSLESRMGQLKLKSSGTFSADQQPTALPAPPIPPRGYKSSQRKQDSQKPFGYPPNNEHNRESGSPQVPQKLPTGIAGLDSVRSTNSSNEAFEQNPTSFYNSPSVFNEGMYSKFSQ